MSLSNTKMGAFLVNQAAVRWEPQRSIHGGVGCSGIAATACAFAMSKDQSLIVTSTCERLFQTSQQIGKLNKKCI